MKKGLRNVCMFTLLLLLIVINTIILIANHQDSSDGSSRYRSPQEIVSCSNTKRIYVGDYTNKSIEVINGDTQEKITSIALSGQPNAMVLAPQGDILYVGMRVTTGQVIDLDMGVTTGQVIDLDIGVTTGQVIALDMETYEPIGHVDVGHTPSALALYEDELIVTNRFSGTIQKVQIGDDGGLVPGTLSIPKYVTREPIGVVVAGNKLYVAGHLPTGTALDNLISSEIVEVNPDTLETLEVIKLTDGATNIKDIKISPDHQYIYVSHALGRYGLPTTHGDRGWIYTNAISEITVRTNEVEATMLVDDLRLGAANPWGLEVDDQNIYLAISGTKELMIIDRMGFRDKIEAIKSGHIGGDGYLTTVEDISRDLTFLTPFKKRIPLGEDGPRGVAVLQEKVFVANYYSGSISILDSGGEVLGKIQLNTTLEEGLARSGERLFNDATIGLGQWQSCSSCHPDGRVDALSWDNLNTGSGTPKQARTMVDSWGRGRVMSTGVRPDTATAIRAGVKHILFNGGFEEEKYLAFNEYIRNIQPEPSPYLIDGQLSESALRGKAVFEGDGGCFACHQGDNKGKDVLIYDNYTQSETVPNGLLVPPLREVWRTAPYLHDGSAETIKDVLTTRNLTNTHGNIDELTEEELEDLIEYALSIGPQGGKR